MSLDNTQTFNDLILDRIIFRTAEESKAILETMFPKSQVNVTVCDENKTIVNVDDVTMTIESLKI